MSVRLLVALTLGASFLIVTPVEARETGGGPLPKDVCINPPEVAFTRCGAPPPSMACPYGCEHVVTVCVAYDDPTAPPPPPPEPPKDPNATHPPPPPEPNSVCLDVWHPEPPPRVDVCITPHGVSLQPCDEPPREGCILKCEHTVDRCETAGPTTLCVDVWTPLLPRVHQDVCVVPPSVTTTACDAAPCGDPCRVGVERCEAFGPASACVGAWIPHAPPVQPPRPPPVCDATLCLADLSPSDIVSVDPPRP